MPVTHPPDLTLQCDVPAMFDQDTADQVAMVGRVRYPGVINSVEFLPNWTRSGADTNYRTLSLYNRGTAGAGTALVASLALTSGVDLTKFVSKTITLGAAADRAVVVGDVLEWVTSPTGTGAPDAGGRVIVQQTITA